MAQISVLIPVYNVESYVAEALASIQSQTFTDIEIVVVDDGSTDGTRRIADQAACSDPRIQVVATTGNRGISGALNLGLKACRSPFIARMDGDDLALPTRLEKQFQFLKEHPRIALVGCATKAIDQAGRPIKGLGVSPKPATQEEIARTLLLASPCPHIWLARRQVYDALSGYREMAPSEDYDFLLRAVTSGFLLSNVSEALMLIRTRPGNASSRIEQRKAHYYAVSLYRERLLRGQDSFSPEGYDRAVKPGKLENEAFRLATHCARRGLQSRIRILRLVLPALSAILSPWQARYFFDRIRFKAALRESRRVCC